MYHVVPFDFLCFRLGLRIVSMYGLIVVCFSSYLSLVCMCIYRECLFRPHFLIYLFFFLICNGFPLVPALVVHRDSLLRWSPNMSWLVGGNLFPSVGAIISSIYRLLRHGRALELTCRRTRHTSVTGVPPVDTDDAMEEELRWRSVSGARAHPAQPAHRCTATAHQRTGARYRSTFSQEIGTEVGFEFKFGQGNNVWKQLYMAFMWRRSRRTRLLFKKMEKQLTPTSKTRNGEDWRG